MQTNTIDWKDIKSYEHSQYTAFEEVVCQLAYNENKDNGQYIRVKAPDGGVESYLTLDNGNEIGWQAKYFFDIQKSQFEQIKKSFKTAITKHPNLVKYYVCCPVDKPDPRIPDKKYLQDRWNDFVDECDTLAQNKGMTVEIEYWGAFELNNKLQKPENAGMVQFWFGGDDFSKIWFDEQIKTSIKNLGARYSAELNVEIHEIADYFNALTKNEKAKASIFEKLNALYKTLESLKNSCGKYERNVEADFIELSSYLDSCWQSISIGNNNHIQFEEVENLSKSLINKLSIISETTNEDDDDTKYIRANLIKFREATYDLEESSRIFSLFNNPYLIVYGDAGIGKSHLLGDFSSNLIKQDKKCIFILGQTLTETTNPWTQILKNELRLECNEDVFLGVLNTIGHAQQQRVPVIIDALNEGEGRSFWKNSLAGFIEKFKKYPWVALVLSVRSEYKNAILTNIQNDINDGIITEIQHHGFQYKIVEAVQSFFEYYQLVLPKEPLLTKEFANPLFLKIYCEYRQNTQTDDFEVIMTEVFDNYFSSINDKVADKFGYRRTLNYVQKNLEKLAEAIFSNNGHSISYEDAMQVVDNNTYTSLDADKFLQTLIDENLLTSYQNKDNTEILYFSYERFSDYLTAKFICNENRTSYDLIFSLCCDKFNIEYNDRYLSQGVLSILSVLIPINFKVELFELLDKDKIYQNYSFGLAFIDGLYWRDSRNFNLERCKDYINSSLGRVFN